MENSFLDDIIRFNKTTSRASVFNIRPDVCIFPSLNVYSIFARVDEYAVVDFSG
ncbi:hypothetical protein [Lacinutrix jangbogonensis]|uniref:hypothetical protein n=1 Tax=Lacinutrix jangbogonensis TaxID=1469557 RepID=UPI000A9671DF|nr:hypothetical protein [Lacinutrix jangbogonensis]